MNEENVIKNDNAPPPHLRVKSGEREVTSSGSLEDQRKENTSENTPHTLTHTCFVLPSNGTAEFTKNRTTVTRKPITRKQKGLFLLLKDWYGDKCLLVPVFYWSILRTQNSLQNRSQFFGPLSGLMWPHFTV